MVECKKFNSSEVGGINVLLSKPGYEGIITNGRKLIYECLSCEFLNKECDRRNREKLLLFLEENDES